MSEYSSTPISRRYTIVDTKANRPAEGSFDGQQFYATDENTSYVWDEADDSWVNTSTNPDQVKIVKDGSGNLTVADQEIGAGWEELDNSPWTFTALQSGDGFQELNFSGSYKEILIVVEVDSVSGSGPGKSVIRYQGNSDTNYTRVKPTGSTSTGNSSFQNFQYTSDGEISVSRLLMARVDGGIGLRHLSARATTDGLDKGFYTGAHGDISSIDYKQDSTGSPDVTIRVFRR